MTIQDLIDQLQRLPNKNRKIFFDGNFYMQGFRKRAEIVEYPGEINNYVVLEIQEKD